MFDQQQDAAQQKKVQLLPTRAVFISKYQLQATFCDNGYQDGVKIYIALLRDFQV